MVFYLPFTLFFHLMLEEQRKQYTKLVSIYNYEIFTSSRVTKS